MPLKCAAKDCLHNNNHLCTSSIIQVDACRANGKWGNYCSTHTNDQGNYLLTAVERPSHPAQAGSIFNAEASEELLPRRHAQSPAILCGVSDCIFNKNKTCGADSISIGRSFRRNTPRFPCRTCKI